MSAAFDAARNAAAAAIRRAGYPADAANIRMVLRAQRVTGDLPLTEDEYWDRIVREMPLGLLRPRRVAKRSWAVSS